VNKIGSIGLSLIPVLLVQKHIHDKDASVTLSAIRFMLIFGTLTSGFLTDRFGTRKVILASFLLSALGLGLLPFAGAVALIAVYGMLAQFGDGLLRVPLRALLGETVEVQHQQEALGWLRVAMNFGQVFSFAIGMLSSGIGLV
jgi:MFS family permease